jgi:nicotinamidase-related amidase
VPPVADVPDPGDPTTQLNWPLLNLLAASDIIAVAGEAKSHCLANTVQDIADNFGVDNIKKIVLLEDATSNVTGFDKLGEDFVKNMKARGMQVTTTKDFLN